MDSNITGGKIFLQDFFILTCKASHANVGIIVNFVYYGKTRILPFMCSGEIVKNANEDHLTNRSEPL